MKKKLATRNFILIAIALLLGCVFSFISFSLPFSNYIFKGFARSFNLGLAFTDGISNTYEVEVSNIYAGEKNDAANYAKDVIQDLVLDKYNDGVVEVVDSNKVSITIPDTTLDQSVLLNFLEMKLESGEEAETLVNGSHIESANYQMSGTNHGVYIEFTSAGKKAFADLTSKAVEKAGDGAKEGTIYIYLGKDYENGQQLSVPEIKEGYAYITMSNKEACKLYASRLMNSRYGINLSTENEPVITHAYFNTVQKVMVAVVVGLIVVGTLVFFAVKYRELGWLTLLALVFFFLANEITLCLLPAFCLNLGGVMGMVFGFVITAITLFILLEKCSQEYKLGKKLPVSFKMGYKKSLGINIDIFASMAVFAILGLIFTSGNMFTFSLALIMAIAFGALTSLLLMRGLMKMYLYINPTKAQKINFKREVEENEK